MDNSAITVSHTLTENILFAGLFSFNQLFRICEHIQ